MSSHPSNPKFDSTNQHIALAGIISGLFSRFIIAPLDVVKIRQQLQAHNTRTTSPNGPTYRGIYGTMRTIVVQEGIRGLWKGNIPAEILYMGYGPVQFVALKEFTLLIDRESPRMHNDIKNALAGGAAGATATIATYPLDLLRTRFAAQGSHKVYSSILHSLQHIYSHEGIQGFYRGLGAGVAQAVPYMGLFFFSYEKLRAHLIPLFGSQLSTSISAGVASMLTKTAVFPFDLVRKRLQVQGPTRSSYVHRNIPVYIGIAKTLRDVVRAEGVRGLYKGLPVSVIKAAPLSAATMWSLEGSIRVLDWFDPPASSREAE